MSKIIFKIYVAGLSSRNEQLISLYNQVCSEKLKSKIYQVEVIDILADPIEAERKKILATPTVIRERPGPEKRAIGDLKDHSNALVAFEFLTNDLNLT